MRQGSHDFLDIILHVTFDPTKKLLTPSKFKSRGLRVFKAAFLPVQCPLKTPKRGVEIERKRRKLDLVLEATPHQKIDFFVPGRNQT